MVFAAQSYEGLFAVCEGKTGQYGKVQGGFGVRMDPTSKFLVIWYMSEHVY